MSKDQGSMVFVDTIVWGEPGTTAPTVVARVDGEQASFADAVILYDHLVTDMGFAGTFDDIFARHDPRRWVSFDEHTNWLDECGLFGPSNDTPHVFHNQIAAGELHGGSQMFVSVAQLAHSLAGEALVSVAGSERAARRQVAIDLTALLLNAGLDGGMDHAPHFDHLVEVDAWLGQIKDRVGWWIIPAAITAPVDLAAPVPDADCASAPKGLGSLPGSIPARDGSALAARLLVFSPDDVVPVVGRDQVWANRAIMAEIAYRWIPSTDPDISAFIACHPIPDCWDDIPAVAAWVQAACSTGFGPHVIAERVPVAGGRLSVDETSVLIGVIQKDDIYRMAAGVNLVGLEKALVPLIADLAGDGQEVLELPDGSDPVVVAGWIDQTCRDRQVQSDVRQVHVAELFDEPIGDEPRAADLALPAGVVAAV